MKLFLKSEKVKVGIVMVISQKLFILSDIVQPEAST